MQLKVAVVGCGSWGKNLVRNFYEIGALKTVCDLDLDILKSVQQKYKCVEVTSDYELLLRDPEIKGVVVASPAQYHYALAKKALLAGKDVYVEKPLALRSERGAKLVEIAENNNRILMVGHILHYHPAIEVLKKLIFNGELGKINYIYSNRLNFGKIRSEENTLWSFAPHDISVILGLINQMPSHVMATGASYLNSNVADTTMSQLFFSNGIRAHIYVSWLHPYKEQKLVIIGEKKMAVFDDTLPWSKKLTLYPHEVVWSQGFPHARKANGVPVQLNEVEPLREECKHFIDCLQTRRKPITRGQEGLNGLLVLNSLQESLDQNGKIVSLNDVVKNDYFAHDTAIIDDGVEVGASTKIWQFCRILPNTKIGKTCSFGQNCVVGPNVSVGDGVKVQNNVSIYEGIEIQDDVFLGPSMVFTNITNPRSFISRRDQFKKTLLRKGCTVGANATIICGTTIGEYSLIGAGAVVTKDVKPFALMCGVPARQVGWVSCRGNKLQFNQSGVAIDAEDGQFYQLCEGEVKLIAKPAEHAQFAEELQG